MASGGAGAALAARLTDLKTRSGLSYEQLARKAHLSRSTVHRYCTGASVPATFAPIEAIATACRASRADLARLYRLWERDDLGGAAIPDTRDDGTGADGADGRASRDIACADAAGVPARPSGNRALAGVALVAALAAVLPVGGSAAMPSPATPPAIEATMWTNAPRALEPEFVGVTTNSNTGQMPSFQVGSVRLWNTRTRWQNLEPARGQYQWNTLDRLVAGARGTGLPVVLTFGGTPSWASPTGRQSVYTDHSRASPPDNLADWERFVRAVAERYHGRIGAYELWDMANHPSFFSGSMDEMVEMTRRASQVIKSVDPAAKVVCPSMGELWDPAALAELWQFAELGGYGHCDAGAVKLDARTAADPPETMLSLAREIEKTLHQAHSGIRLWSTGGAYDVNHQRPLDQDRGADHAVRFFLSGLYAGYRRMYFYNWGSAKLPIVLQPTGGPETKAARHVARLHQWLADSQIHSCGQGRPAGLPDHLWQCRFGLRGKTFLIWWTIDRHLRVPAAPGTTSVERLDGSSTPAMPGTVLTVTGSPVLLRLG